MTARVGADVGGTFTDVICVGDDGRVSFTKVLSTPPAYDRAVVSAVAELAAARRSTSVVHGTTVATNAVLERRGARLALVTTEGFRDVLELRRMRMPHLYDYFWTKPPSLVPRRDRFEIAERMAADGDRASSRSTRTRRARSRPGSRRRASRRSRSACCTRTSTRPTSSGSARSSARELPGIPVSLSSEVTREQQEYERTATTVVNAYVAPLMGRYVADLRGGLDAAGVAAPLTVLQSSGGTMTAADAAARPVYALESGPAAGVVAALSLAAGSSATRTRSRSTSAARPRRRR